MSVRDFSLAPFHIRYSRKSDFEPKLVSIGPQYFQQIKLRDMEDLKVEFTNYFLKMETAARKFDIDDLIRRLDRRVSKEDIYDWYGGKDELALALEWDELLKMLVLDSCFIIRIMMYLSREAKYQMLFLSVNVKMVRFDLLLLENQIPLFFLKEVYDVLQENSMLPHSQSQRDQNKAAPRKIYF